jgi:hypothetical protein
MDYSNCGKYILNSEEEKNCGQGNLSFGRATNLNHKRITQIRKIDNLGKIHSHGRTENQTNRRISRGFYKKAGKRADQG